MLRAALYAMMALSLAAFSMRSTDATNEPENKGADHVKAVKAIITEVDPQNSAITVKIEDKEGKNLKKTFRLVQDTAYVDGNGRVAILNAFQSDADILFVQANGKIEGLKTPTSEKPGR